MALFGRRKRRSRAVPRKRMPRRLARGDRIEVWDEIRERLRFTNQKVILGALLLALVIFWSIRVCAALLRVLVCRTGVMLAQVE